MTALVDLFTKLYSEEELTVEEQKEIKDLYPGEQAMFHLAGRLRLSLVTKEQDDLQELDDALKDVSVYQNVHETYPVLFAAMRLAIKERREDNA